MNRVIATGAEVLLIAGLCLLVGFIVGYRTKAIWPGVRVEAVR